MNFAIIGRTKTLLKTAELLISEGHKLTLVITSKASKEYTADDLEYKNFAKINGAKFIYAPRIDDEVLSQVENIDVGISLNYITIIPQAFINKFRFGIINAHTGDLPRYKGNAVVAWALIHGEKEVVNTIHFMDGDKLDSGDIIVQSKFPVSLNTRIKEVYSWFEEQCPKDFLKALDKVLSADGKIGHTQVSTGKKHMRCYPRLPEDGLINWKENAKTVIRHINASGYPFAGAFSFFDGEKIVFDLVSEVEDLEDFYGVPGHISLINKGEKFIEVLAGNSTKIRVHKVVKNGVQLDANQIVSSMRKRFRNK